MTSLAFASQGDCGRESPQTRHWRRRAASLQSETEILNRIIRTHEATLEEISELVFQELQGAKQITTHQLMGHYTHPQPKMHAVEQQIHQEIAAQIGQLVTNYRQNFIKAFQNLLADHSVSVGELKKQLRVEGRMANKLASERADCDTSIQEHTSAKALFEIPIEVQLLRETADSDVQVDLFQPAKNIYEIPVELKEIFEIPIELETLQVVEKRRIFEVPVQIDEVFEVGELEGNHQNPFANIIQEGLVFTSYKNSGNAIELENASLRAQIEKLLQQISNLKQSDVLQRQIYQIPVEMQPIGEADLDGSRCEAYVPNIESQTNLDKQLVSSKYDSIKQAESKISTQVCTRPDLDLSPLLEMTEGKSSIILSSATPIQQSITYPHHSSSAKNLNFVVSQKHINQVEEALDEGSDFMQDIRNVPVQIEMDGETIQIEMEIMHQVETSEKEVQTDASQEQEFKRRIAKMPVLKIVEVPYEVERVVERILKVPVLKVIEVPVQVESPQILQVPLQMSTVLEQHVQQQRRITLKSANHDPFLEKAQMIEKVVVKQVPIEVIIEKQLPPRTIVKEVPVEVYIDRFVQLPPRTIIKQVPVQVIIEKEIIVQKIICAPPRTIIKQVPVEVIVEKIIELPAKTIIKEVPIEVIVQRIKEVLVEMPARTIIKEVPVQVLVERTVVKEVPVELILQKIVELPPRTIIKEVPVEVLIEKEVPVPVEVEKIVHIFHQIPIEVIVEKEVKKIEVREIPIEVEVEKIVQVTIIKQVAVEVLLEVPTIVQVPVQAIVQKKVAIVKEIPYEVVVVQEVEVPVIQYVPVEIPVQVQKIVEVVKIVKEIVQVPVMIWMEEEMGPLFGRDLTISEVPAPSQSGPHLLLQSHYPTEHEQQQQTSAILEVPVQVVVQKQVVRVKEVPIELLSTMEVVKEVAVPKIFQIPTELLLVEEKERIVYVEKIVEVPIEVVIEKLIYIQKIVEVPIQVIVEKPIAINSPHIVEVPIEVIVYKERLVEVPVQVIVEKEVFVDRIVEVPVEIIEEQEETQLDEVPIHLQAQNHSAIKLKSMEQMRQDRQDRLQKQGDYEIVYEFAPEAQESGQDVVYHIDTHLANEHSHEIVIEIPMAYMRSEQMNSEAQTESIISHQLQSESYPPSYKLNSRPSYEEVFTSEAATQTAQMAEKVKIIQMPIEVQNINFEQMQKEVQIKYRDYLADLKDRYGAEITELAKSVVDLQSIIIEANAQKENLKEKIEGSALKEQSLLKELQSIANQKKIQIEQFERQTEQLQAEIKENKTFICILKEEIDRLQASKHKIQEIPVEINSEQQMQAQKVTSDAMMQTEDIRLILPTVIEIPEYVHQVEFVDIPEEYDQWHIANNQKRYQQEDILNEAHQEEEWRISHLKAGFEEKQHDYAQCQTEKINFIYEIPLQLNMATTAACFQVQTDFTVHQAQDIIVLRETPKNPYDLLLEIPTELIQPIVYQIPTEVNLLKDTQDAEIQTQPMQTQRKIFELPVEFKTISETNQAEIQTLPVATNSSEQSQSSQEERKYNEDDELADRVAQRRQQQMSQDSFFRKKKPYSEYFTSRIFEIPVELNLKKEDPLKLLSTEVQTEASELSPVLDAGISNVILSRQRELVVSNLRIVPAFEPMKLVAEPTATPIRRSPQRKIFRFGSENDTLGVNPNFSHVHSMTPNQLQSSSSYDKFPLPTININNISLIKKSSIHSEGKFFGSLDMREELLTHEEAALASVRMANKKLAGFQQGESSSEEGDLHNEMIIEENETIVSRDINRIQTPNLEPHDLNFSEYATLREKLYEPEEEKINYQELYDNAHNDLQALKQKLYLKSEELADLKLDLDRESCRYQEQIRKINDELAAAHKEIIEQEAASQGYKARVSELEETKARLQRKIEMLFENWERLKDESEKNEIASGKEFDRLRAIISEKMAEIKELRADEHHQKEAFENQLQEYREIIRQKGQIIEELQEQLVAKNDRIEQLSDKLQEMRKTMSHNNEADTAAIYQQEFQRVKEVFQDEKRELNYQYLELKEQNEHLREAIAEEQHKREELEATIVDLERQVIQAKQDYSSLHHLKSELENNFMEGVKCLNQQLQEMKGLVREKDEIIHHINPSLQSATFDHEQPLRVEYISKQPSMMADGNKHLQAYSRKLENLLKKYQRIIIENAGRIEELQEKVYQYLKDALQKEQEAEGLYMKLVDYENTINSILVEKVTLDIENKRLCKQIELSEKKLNVLGTRLIEVARNRAEYDSDEDYCYD